MADCWKSSAPILSVGDALDQAHVQSRGLIERVQHPAVGEMRLVRGPITFDGAGPGPSTAPSLLGEDTRQVLTADLGMSEEDVSDLVARGVVNASG